MVAINGIEEGLTLILVSFGSASSDPLFDLRLVSSSVFSNRAFFDFGDFADFDFSGFSRFFGDFSFGESFFVCSGGVREMGTITFFSDFFVL